VRVPGDGDGVAVPCMKVADVAEPTFSRQKSKLTLPGSIICGQVKGNATVRHAVNGRTISWTDGTNWNYLGRKILLFDNHCGSVVNV